MMKRKILIMMLALLVLALFNSAAIAETIKWTEPFGHRTNQPIDKDWTINFNKNLDPTTVNAVNFFVANDLEGINKQPVLPVLESNKVLIPHPVSGYKPNSTYYLFIKAGIRSSDGSRLEENIRMGFTIIESNTVPSTPPGGGGGGSTPPPSQKPVVNSITFTVDNQPITVIGYNNNFDINLAGYDDNSMFTNLSINASSNAEKAVVTFLGIHKEVNFVNGYANVSVKEILGSINSGENGISLKTLKVIIKILSNEIPITVYGSNGTYSTVKVKIIIP
jgi:hypothetical protein